jgi:hypothetical protein
MDHGLDDEVNASETLVDFYETTRCNIQEGYHLIYMCLRLSWKLLGFHISVFKKECYSLNLISNKMC